MRKPDFDKLVDHVEGMLPAAEAAELARYLEDADDATRDDLRWLSAFAKVSAKTILDDPPMRVRRDLEAAFDERFVAKENARESPSLSYSGVFGKILAALTFDSDSQAAFGVRSAGALPGEAQRQLAYETEVADISISIQPRPGAKFGLLGQVLPLGDENPEDFTVQLVRPDETGVALENADDLGEFSFEGIGVGEYRIVVATAEAEILTPEFRLGA